MTTTTADSDDIMYGDINGDGRVDALDALYLARHRAGWPGYPLDERAKKAADVNGDGVIDIFDSLYLARHLMGLEEYKHLGPR